MSFTYFPEATLAVARLVAGISELLVGRDPNHNVAIWRDLRNHAWWYGTGTGLASMALSGIDIALWDLKGRLSGASLVDMLGGPAHPQLPAVASVHGTKASISEMVNDFAGHLEGGGCRESRLDSASGAMPAWVSNPTGISNLSGQCATQSAASSS